MKKYLKWFFIFMGIVTSAYTLVWQINTKPVRDSGIDYIHSVLYVQPEFIARLGPVTPKNISKYDAEQTGSTYALRIYEDVKSGEKDLCVITEIVSENNTWRVLWMSVMGNGISKQLVANGKWVTE